MIVKRPDKIVMLNSELNESGSVPSDGCAEANTGSNIAIKM